MSETTARVGVTIGTKADPAPVDRYTRSVQAMRDSIKGLLTSGHVAQFGAAFSAGAISVQAMVGRISEAVSGSSELASEMAAVQRRTGLAGEAFQVLARSGKVASEELIASFAKYRVELGKALLGDKGARDAFAGLGLSPEALARMSGERQLESVGAALQRLGDKNKEAAEAQALFGRGSVALLPMLEKLGTEGYDKLRAKISATEGVLSNEMSAAINKAKKENAEAANQLSIALAPTNLRLLKMKAAITSLLADNAGTIQSAGSGLAGGLLTATVLSQLASRIGPQIDSIGALAARGFTHGFGVGMRTLPGLIANVFSGPSMLTMFSGLGKALATPFGAAFAVAVGGFIIAELQRRALERIGADDQRGRSDLAKLGGIRSHVQNAGNPADAMAAQVEAATFLSQQAQELEALRAKKKEVEEEAKKSALAVSATGAAVPTAKKFSDEDAERLRYLENEVQLAQRLVQFANDKAAAYAKTNAEQQKLTDQQFSEAAELEKTRAAREGLMEREQQNRYAGLTDDKARLAFLDEWKKTEEDAYAKKLAATQNVELRGDIELQQRVKIAEIDAKIAQVRKNSDDARNERLDAAQKEIDDLFQWLERATRQKTLDDGDKALRELQLRQAQTEGDYTRTTAEKWNERRAQLQEEIKIRQGIVEQLRAQRDATPDAAAKATLGGDIRGQEDSISGIYGDMARMGADPTSWVEQTRSSITALREEWGTTAQQIAGSISGTISSAVSVLSDNISGLILGTRTWREAVANVANSIVTGLVSAIVTMGVRWVATQIMMAVAGKAIAASATAANVPIAMAQSAIWAVPATLATIASFGGAAAQAPFSIAGAIGITEMMAVLPGAGFAVGGFTGRGEADEPAGLVHRGEWVAPKWMVEDGKYGPLIAALEAGRRGLPGYKFGGSFGWDWGHTLAFTGYDKNVGNYFSYSGGNENPVRYGDDTSIAQMVASADTTGLSVSLADDAGGAGGSSGAAVGGGSGGKPERLLVVDYRERGMIDRMMGDPRFRTRMVRIGYEDRGALGMDT